MAAELLTLRDLRVQTLKERREGRLTKIPNSFYEQIKNLEKQIRNVIENSKGNVKRLEKSNSDMRKLMDLKLDLHKIRERKLTDLAREKINGQSANTDNVHANETEYLESICSVIEKHRKNTLISNDYEFIPEVKTEIEQEAKVEGKPDAEIVSETDTKIVEEPNVEKPKQVVEEKSDNPEYLSVKVLEDLPTFTGMDAKNYTLKNGDTESIPKYNARMLSDAGKVKLINEVKV